MKWRAVSRWLPRQAEARPVFDAHGRQRPAARYLRLAVNIGGQHLAQCLHAVKQTGGAGGGDADAARIAGEAITFFAQCGQIFVHPETDGVAAVTANHRQRETGGRAQIIAQRLRFGLRRAIGHDRGGGRQYKLAGIALQVRRQRHDLLRLRRSHQTEPT
jgi:hypothetical protein